MPDDIAGLRAAGVDVLVSLLKPDEAAELGLDDEAHAREKAGIEFVSLPVLDRGVPENTEKFIAVAEELRTRVETGRSIGIHCRAGIGRSAMLAATILVLGGHRADEAWARIEQARGVPVPDTREQRNGIEGLTGRAR